MPEDIMQRLNRLASAGRKPPEKPQRVFEMPVKEVIEQPRGAGALMKMLDAVDVKAIGRVR